MKPTVKPCRVRVFYLGVFPVPTNLEHSQYHPFAFRWVGAQMNNPNYQPSLSWGESKEKTRHER